MSVQPAENETESWQTGLVLYRKEKDVIDDVLIKALRSKSRVRLSMAQAIRLLIRKGDLKALTEEDFEAAAVDNKEIRRLKTQKKQESKK